MVKNSMAKAAVRKSQACLPLSMGGRLEGSTEGSSWSCEMHFSSTSLRGGESWSFGSTAVVAGVLSIGSLDMFLVDSTWTRLNGRMRWEDLLTVLDDGLMDLALKWPLS
jgi:hypothetical protein